MAGHINLTPTWGKTVTELTAPGRQTTRPAGTIVAHAPDGQSRAVLGPAAPRGAAARGPDGALYPYLTEDAPEVVTMVTKTGTAQTTADTAVTDAAAAQTTADTGVTNAATAQARADLAHTYIGDANTRLVSLEASRTSMREDIAGANTRLIPLESWQAMATPQLAGLVHPTTGTGARLSAHDALFSDVNVRINGVVGVNNQQNADLASAGSQLVSLNSQMGVLTHPTTGVGARLAGIDSRLGGHDSDLASASSRINAKANQTDLNATNSRVGTLETGKASNADVTAVANGVTNLQSSVRSFFNSLSSYVEANFQKTGSGTRPVWPS